MRCVDPVIGRAAYSKAGRDKEKLLIVVGIIDEDFVLVADGRLRPIERPKKKRIKHLRFTGLVASSIAEKIEKGKRLMNTDLQNAISQFHVMLADCKDEGGFKFVKRRCH